MITEATNKVREAGTASHRAGESASVAVAHVATATQELFWAFQSIANNPLLSAKERKAVKKAFNSVAKANDALAPFTIEEPRDWSENL